MQKKKFRSWKEAYVTYVTYVKRDFNLRLLR
jgi:hypothetical protein